MASFLGDGGALKAGNSEGVGQRRRWSLWLRGHKGAGRGGHGHGARLEEGQENQAEAA